VRLHVLASGSGGNALAAEVAGGFVLFDCGLGPRVLARRLQQVGLPVERLKALVLTHEHTDHVKGLGVLPVSVSHDALEPVGFGLENGRVRVGVVTDTGVVTELLLERLAGCHGLFLEANHDLDMLRFGPYPPVLKQRIASRHGHLSNEQARDALERLAHDGLRTVVAMHLSEENNRPALVVQELSRVLAGSPVKLAVASQREPLSVAVEEGR